MIIYYIFSLHVHKVLSIQAYIASTENDITDQCAFAGTYGSFQEKDKVFHARKIIHILSKDLILLASENS
ncbi:hypothetical protein PV02_01645 [Methanolobus chelungpuianus]|uniref:Uncharacterized protein n=2 Tax=Methanolobus chelungpuianus TaxID=502115 RepID=A0AAE3H8V8_9EURY|nr:hypothetical protein [Methanolobus chelungpuianus]